MGSSVDNSNKTKISTLLTLNPKDSSTLNIYLLGPEFEVPRPGSREREIGVPIQRTKFTNVRKGQKCQNYISYNRSEVCHPSSLDRSPKVVNIFIRKFVSTILDHKGTKFMKYPTKHLQKRKLIYVRH